MQPHTCLYSPAYPAADDQRFRPNVTGDSAGSALLLFFTPVGHDQSTCADCRDLGSIGRESGRQVWRVDTLKLRRAVRLWWLLLNRLRRADASRRLFQNRQRRELAEAV